jgi:hypothetical protein
LNLLKSLSEQAVKHLEVVDGLKFSLVLYTQGIKAVMEVLEKAKKEGVIVNTPSGFVDTMILLELLSTVDNIGERIANGEEAAIAEFIDLVIRRCGK